MELNEEGKKKKQTNFDDIPSRSQTYLASIVTSQVPRKERVLNERLNEKTLCVRKFSNRSSS
jgi:hypothetical protein